MFLTNRVHASSENNSARPMDGQERIEIGSAGFGEASNSTLEERARQIAASDGRTEVNDLDYEEARRQLNNPLSDREDADELIAESDRPDAGVAPASLGRQKKKTPPDDESVVAEKLVREGVEEAEFDTRVRSAENEQSSTPNG
jgi:Mg-chelatase subunit ChlI